MGKSSPITLAERFQWIRSQKACTLAEVAKGTGLGVSYLSKLASGSRPNPSASATLALATFFGVNREWLEAGRGQVYSAVVAEGARRGVNDLLRDMDATIAGSSCLEAVLANVSVRVEQFRFSSDAQRTVYLREILQELTDYSEECARSYPRIKDALLKVARAMSDEEAARSIAAPVDPKMDS